MFLLSIRINKYIILNHDHIYISGLILKVYLFAFTK